MINALDAKSKMGFLDGTLKKPEESSPDYVRWRKCNSMLLSQITNALSEDLQSSVAHTSTAAEIWTDLEERYSQVNAPRIHQLKRDLSNLEQGDNQSIASYYNRFKSLWDELQAYDPLPRCTCGANKEYVEKREAAKAHDFLLGLSANYNPLRSQILNMTPMPNLSRIYALAIQDEKQ